MYVNINHFYIQKNKLFYIQLSTLITIIFIKSIYSKYIYVTTQLKTNTNFV